MSESSSQNFSGQGTGPFQEAGTANRNPIKVLAWGDSAIAGTGFGVVARHVLQAVHATGRYEIHQLAINHHGDFVNSKEIPWQMQPARLMDPRDGHGMKMFIRTISKGDYDIVWILNDLYVTHEVTQLYKQFADSRRAAGKKVPVVIYYYPVDCHVQAERSSFIGVTDIPVCYTDHGRIETLLSWPGASNKLVQIPHGVDSDVFKPLPLEAIKAYKAKITGTTEDRFLVINVNRNSTRKQIQYSMLAFKEFKKRVPNAVMYIHSAMKDQSGDLSVTVKDLGMSMKNDFIFPLGYSSANPVNPPTLNMLYNTSDMFLTTHLGEGWGLTITEAMSAGTPVVAPNNTCMPQQLGEQSERGYMYPCNDRIWIDDSGFRPKGLLTDIVEKMIEVYRAGPKEANPKVQLAREWAVQHDWRNVHQNWIDVFNKAEILAKGVPVTEKSVGEIV